MSRKAGHDIIGALRKWRYAMKKRIFTFSMFLCVLLASLAGRMQHVGAKNPEEKTVYVAFGDSIAAGYGLDGYSEGQTHAPAESYQTLTGKFLKTNALNYAVSGDNSSDCMRLLESGKADDDLKNADIISLSIGSNDLLKPFIQIVKKNFNTSLIANLKDNATLHAQAAAFAEKFASILAILHEKAPAAKIYVTNVYNPFRFLPVLGGLAETYIQEINETFSADAPDYVLVDVYTPFSKKELVNAHFNIRNPSDFNPDPHPSVEGHRAIADAFIRALKKTHAPKAAVLGSVSSDSVRRLTVSADIPADADGYQVRYASSKNGAYRTLATSEKKTYRTNSKKLKPGKTYYIKVRSRRTVKGVTYYGKESAAKAVKIRASVNHML